MGARTPPPTPPAPTTATPGRAIDPVMKTNPTPVPGIAASSFDLIYNVNLAPSGISKAGGTPMVSTSSAGSLASLVNLLPGGSIIGAGIDLFGGLGKSKCPGPYNYNPRTGGCDPKPGTFVGGTGTNGGAPKSCPSGTTYDAATGQCKVGGVTGAVQRGLPGGATGYVSQDWTPTMAYGMQGFVPQTVPTSRLQCPAGYVLYGNKNGQAPGMEICLPKGFLANKHRKWPRPPRPAMTAQDVKTLNRINAIQRKVSNMAVKAGYQKPRKR